MSTESPAPDTSQEPEAFDPATATFTYAQAIEAADRAAEWIENRTTSDEAGDAANLMYYLVAGWLKDPAASPISIIEGDMLEDVLSSVGVVPLPQDRNRGTRTH